MPQFSDLQPLKPYLLPLGIFPHLPWTEVAAALDRVGWKVLPAVPKADLVESALRAYPVAVVVTGAGLADLPTLRELTLDHAAEWCDFSTVIATADALVALIQQALQKRQTRVSSAFFTGFIELLPDAVFFKDRCGRFLAGNTRIASHFGLSDPALIIGRSDFDFFSLDHAQPAFDDEQEIIRTGRPMTAKLERETFIADRETWCLTWKAPLKDEYGRVIGTFGFSRDATELKTTELALATERHLLEALLKSIPDSIFIKDTKGRFLLANPVLAGWMGTTPDKLQGKTDADFYADDMLHSFKQDDESVMSTGMPVINREEKVLTADGRELWVLTSKVPYTDKTGKLAGIIGLSRNITLRRDFEQQLSNANQEIAKLREQLAQLPPKTVSDS